MRRFLALILSAAMTVLPARAADTEKCVALTFDDGPAGKYTQKLLDGLYDRGVHATFALCGYRMEQFPDTTRRIFEEGHEIAYHGFTHSSMQPMSRRDIAAELIRSQALLPPGCVPVFLRPPGGRCSDAVRQVAEVRKLALLSWSVDPRDWATRDALAVEKAVLRDIRDGDIVLLHDMSDSSVRAALNIIDALLEQDYRIVTVSELAKLRDVKLKPGQIYTSFPRKEEKIK